VLLTVGDFSEPESLQDPRQARRKVLRLKTRPNRAGRQPRLGRWWRGITNLDDRTSEPLRAGLRDGQPALAARNGTPRRRRNQVPRARAQLADAPGQDLPGGQKLRIAPA
jgi:hypothetical protein